MKGNSLVLGYHGCDREFGEALLAGSAAFKPSVNRYDWLGSGVYFWENNPARAREWARFMQKRGKIKEPFAVGAVLDVGECLDTTEATSLEAIKASYDALAKAAALTGEVLPKNKKANSKNEELIFRDLDCLVINYLHALREEDGLSPFDTVRGAFWEGRDLYPGSGIKEKTHIQICVRSMDNIKGVFRILPEHG
ncbi:MAG: hypothetical protein LBW77_06710 [Verrucomicrobiota bacterium]|jgi:hypothetical protein|nr:hypothetical protein [Verrucomicrobiota bacterium]